MRDGELQGGGSCSIWVGGVCAQIRHERAFNQQQPSKSVNLQLRTLGRHQTLAVQWMDGGCAGVEKVRGGHRDRSRVSAWQTPRVSKPWRPSEGCVKECGGVPHRCWLHSSSARIQHIAGSLHSTARACGTGAIDAIDAPRGKSKAQLSIQLYDSSRC